MSKTLIYIIGAGRSGTTLLDITLGNNRDSISLGEFNRFFKRNGSPPKRPKEDKVFLFWKDIAKEIEKRIDKLDYQLLNNLFYNNEYHTTFFKSVFKNNDDSYIETLKTKYNTLTSKVNETYLIESSKYPVRALNLSHYIKSETLEIKYIYIKKDPVKVVKSFGKKNLEQPSKNFITANIYYLMVNLLCETTSFILKKRGHQVYYLNYDEFINSPNKTLGNISKKLNLNLERLELKIKKNEPLDTGFLFDGNRIRLKETITLRVLDKKLKKDFKYYFTRIFNYLIYR